MFQSVSTSALRFALFGWFCVKKITYLQTYNRSRTLVGNEIVDHSDVVGASPVGDV